MDRKQTIQNAYRLTGSNSFYDGMITCSTLPGKAVCRLVWAMNRAECESYLALALSGVPEQFSGSLLEVPVGTGVLTMPLYKTLPRAQITCLDYSPDMMAQAQEKALRLALSNVSFRQGDVGALPFADESFDIVLSLNGFHAFPDKDAAYRETFRVLKPGGTFCGCFYVRENTTGPTGSSAMPMNRQNSSRRRMRPCRLFARGCAACTIPYSSAISKALRGSSAGRR